MVREWTRKGILLTSGGDENGAAIIENRIEIQIFRKSKIES